MGLVEGGAGHLGLAGGAVFVHVADLVQLWHVAHFIVGDADRLEGFRVGEIGGRNGRRSRGADDRARPLPGLRRAVILGKAVDQQSGDDDPGKIVNFEHFVRVALEAPGARGG